MSREDAIKLLAQAEERHHLKTFENICERRRFARDLGISKMSACRALWGGNGQNRKDMILLRVTCLCWVRRSFRSAFSVP